MAEIQTKDENHSSQAGSDARHGNSAVSSVSSAAAISLQDGRANDALKYSWDWFALHANQRMQSVNFFIVAASFLTSAYVLAMKEHMFPVGVGVSALGTTAALLFYMLERRIRELIHAGEAALETCEDALVKSTRIETLRITTSIRIPKAGIWRYSSTLSLLYLATAVAFFLGGILPLLPSNHASLKVAELSQNGRLGLAVLVFCLLVAFAPMLVKSPGRGRMTFFYIMLVGVVLLALRLML